MIWTVSVRESNSSINCYRSSICKYRVYSLSLRESNDSHWRAASVCVCIYKRDKSERETPRERVITLGAHRQICQVTSSTWQVGRGGGWQANCLRFKCRPRRPRDNLLQSLTTTSPSAVQTHGISSFVFKATIFIVCVLLCIEKKKTFLP